jgi:hypothetical protein
MARKFWPLLLILVGAVAFYWLAKEEPAAPVAVSAAAPAKVVGEPAAAPGPAQESPVPGPAAAPVRPSVPQPMRTPVTPGMVVHTTAPVVRQPDPPRGPDVVPDEAREEADGIALNLRNYGSRYGGNPAGTNAEIVKALNGGNAQGVRFLSQELLRLNSQGELVDRWDTPYFFHQMSASHMEVRSAGPDKMLWTSDDIVVQ